MLKRTTPLRRDTEKAREFQRRGTPLKRGGPIKRNGQHRINGAVREAVKGRSGGFCEARIVCRGANYEHIHHKLMRSQGGRDSAQNCIAVCFDCHRHIHDHPAESYASGHLIRSSGVTE